MSVKIIGRVWEDQTITNKIDLIVLLALADNANDEGSCYPGIETIARKSRLSIRGVQEVIRRLQATGKLDIKTGKSPVRTNLYQLHYPVAKQGCAGCGVESSQVAVDSSSYGVGCARCTPQETGELSYEIPAAGCTLTVNNHQERQEPSERSTSPPDEAEAIYALYPKKVARPKALKAIRKVLKEFPADEVKAATAKFAECWKGRTDMQYCPYPASWFNAEGFKDDPETWKRPGIAPPSMRDLRFKVDAIETQIQEINGRGSTVAGGQWIPGRDGDREKLKTLKEQKRTVLEQISQNSQ